jgi:hypothetical protein
MFSAKGATSDSVKLEMSAHYSQPDELVFRAHRGFLSTLMNKIRSIVMAAYEWMT